MIFETYAQRKKLAAKGDQPDVYSYDEVPKQLRHQICIILRDSIGRYTDSDNDFHRVPNANEAWRLIHRICAKEIMSYAEHGRGTNIGERFRSYLSTTADIDEFLSALEIACRLLDFIDKRGRNADLPYGDPDYRGAEQKGEDALNEINHRFEQHAVGYQYENGEFIRVDSKLEHSEIIKPALALLVGAQFTKANADFMAAHRHYRSSEYKDCVTAANRAFERMLKAICDMEKWEYLPGDNAAQLITCVNKQGLFTHAFDRTFESYVAMLKAGLPAIRNNAGAHGESVAAAEVTSHIARLALNFTASLILFLGASYNSIKRQR